MNWKEIFQDSSFLINFNKHLIWIILILLLFRCTPSSMEKIEIQIAGEAFIVEVAREWDDQEDGLMHRAELGQREGMLFVYDYDKLMKFWNNNVNFPLSIAFLTKTGMIVQIEDMKGGDPSTIYSKYSVRYALEVNQGIFEELGIGLNDYIIFPDDFNR